MNKINLLLGAFIASAVFLLGCSSECEKCDECNVDKPSSSSIKTPSSSSGGNVVNDQKLVRKNITLSSDKSYADIDEEPVAYTKEDASKNLKKIDLIAYCDTGCKNNSIYSPYEIDLFWNPNYAGSDIYLFEIPPEQSDKADIFKTATRLYEILQTYNDLVSTFTNNNALDEIPIEEGKVFFVLVPENGVGIVTGIVIIKQVGENSVDLEIIERPIPSH